MREDVRNHVGQAARFFLLTLVAGLTSAAIFSQFPAVSPILFILALVTTATVLFALLIGAGVFGVEGVRLAGSCSSAGERISVALVAPGMFLGSLTLILEALKAARLAAIL